MTAKRKPRGPDQGKRKPRRDADAVAKKLAERNRTQTTAGTIRPLEHGAVSAIKGLRYRVPEGTAEPLASLADDAFEAVVAVMRGGYVRGGGSDVLRAATRVRDEICGPLAQKVEHSGTITLENILRASEDPKAPEGTA